MGVGIVGIKDLGLALLLECGTCLEHGLDWQLIKNLFLVCGVICEVDYCLDRTNATGGICPFVDSSRYFLDTAPVNEYFVPVLPRCVICEIVFSHPVDYLPQRLHRQPSVYFTVLA